MMPDSINRLVENFQKFPGVGEKTALRYALSVYGFDTDDSEEFSKAIIDVKNKVKKCSVCNNLTEEDKCSICLDSSRKNGILCVVEDYKDLLAFERSGAFNGRYHVLNGLISPLNGINPDTLNIKSLVDRVKKEDIKEIILAIKPSIEGETTALYIKKLFEGYNDLIVSKVANGLPIGADIEYIDSLTLERAIEDRRNLL